MISAATDVQAAIDAKYRAWRWRIFGVTWLTYASYYLVRKSFSVAKVAFTSDGVVQFTKEQMGRVDAAYSTAYCAGQFIWGPLSDRFGPRRVILFGMLLAVIVSTLNGVVATLSAFIVLQLLLGVAQSSGWSPLVKNMSSWFSFRERGTVMGVWCTNFAVGGFVATIFAGQAVAIFGATSWGAEIGKWRFAFFAPAAVLFFVWLAFLAFQRDKPEDVGLPPIEEHHGEAVRVIEPGDRVADEPEGSWHVVAEVLRSPVVWILAVGYFSLKMTRYAFLFWGPLLVKESVGSGVGESTIVASMFEIGGPLGVFAAGYATDRIFGSRRMPATSLSLFVVAALLVFAHQFVVGPIGLGVFLFAIGFFLFGPDTLISGTAAMDFGTKKGAGTAAGLINGIGSLGQVVGGYLPGWLAQDTTSSSGRALRKWTEKTLHTGETGDWQISFYVFAAALTATAILFLPLWNRRPAVAADNRPQASK